MENPDCPFDGGIKYTTMPPSKRFRDMHQLSGGEKTLAALALCFAVHHFQNPPFVILDEVDAPLDCFNVRSIRRYISRATHIQAIVISLKDEFFCQSNALWGIYKDQAQDQSGTVSLDYHASKWAGPGGGGGSPKLGKTAMWSPRMQNRPGD